MKPRFGTPKRTIASKKAAMEARITLCTDEMLATITPSEMQRHGFYRQEAEARLAAERVRRGLVDVGRP